MDKYLASSNAGYKYSSATAGNDSTNDTSVKNDLSTYHHNGKL